MPATPTISLVADDANGAIAITVANPDSPNEGNSIFRQTPALYGGAFIKIASGVAIDGTFTDYNVASLLNHTYFAAAVDSGISANSTTATESVTLDYLFLQTTNKSGVANNASNRLALLNLIPHQIDQARDAVEFIHSGQDVPTVIASDIGDRLWRMNVLITPADESKLVTLNTILEAKTTVVARMQREGSILFGTMSELTRTYWHNHILLPLIFEETSYSEAIAA